MDSTAFSTWLSKINQYLLDFLSNPTSENEAALLSMIRQYRMAAKEQQQ